MKIIYQSSVEFIVRFEKGEHYLDSFKAFLKETGVESAVFSGIGGFLEAELSYYDLEKEKYLTQTFNDGPYEVSSLTGNVSLLDDEIMIHNHAVLGDREYNAITGHLENAVIGGTLELYVKLIDKTGLHRAHDKETGLDLLTKQ